VDGNSSTNQQIFSQANGYANQCVAANALGTTGGTPETNKAENGDTGTVTGAAHDTVENMEPQMLPAPDLHSTVYMEIWLGSSDPAPDKNALKAIFPKQGQ
jgi:hypothetical protein